MGTRSGTPPRSLETSSAKFCRSRNRFVRRQFFSAINGGIVMAFEVSIESAFVDPGTNALQFVMRDPLTDEYITVLVGADALRKLGGSDNPLKILEPFTFNLQRARLPKLTRTARVE